MSAAMDVTTANNRGRESLRPHQSTLSSEITQAIRPEPTGITKVVAIDSSPRYTQDPIPIEELYPDPSASSNVLGNALGLLNSAIESLSSAVTLYARGDVIESDEAAMRCQALLPELFCCRGLGDGFGGIVNAAMFAFNNATGIPLNGRQLEGLQIGLGRIRSEPYLSFDAAVQIITYLEDLGLTVDPPEFATPPEALDAKSLR